MFGLKKSKNNIIINGRSIEVTGNNISIINDKVYVDGELVEQGLTNDVKISFEGDLANIKTEGNINISGNVKGDINSRGSVHCNNVTGNVDAGGSITCDYVGGSVDAGGSVSCGNVHGSIHAGGSVRGLRL